MKTLVYVAVATTLILLLWLADRHTLTNRLTDLEADLSKRNALLDPFQYRLLEQLEAGEIVGQELTEVPEVEAFAELRMDGDSPEWAWNIRTPAPEPRSLSVAFAYTLEDVAEDERNSSFFFILARKGRVTEWRMPTPAL